VSEPGRAWRFLDARMRLAPIRDFLREKSVPRHRHTWAYFFGGIALFFFLLQVASGVLLLLYYHPFADGAFESVEFIMTRVEFGWLVRSVHSWSANLMVLAVFVHMFSVFFMKSYAPPRDLTWWSGVLLLALTLTFGFSGYLLPWNQLAFFATRVGTEMMAEVPLVGGWIATVLRGGERISSETLTRFFGFHVAILPLAAVVLIGFHLFLLQRQNLHVPPSAREEARRRRPIPFFPEFALRELAVWLIGLAAVAALAAFYPWELGEKADPFGSAPSGIQPEWYFLFVFQTLKLIPSRVAGLSGETLGIAAFILVSVLWFLVPVLDRRARRGQSSPGFTVLGWLAIAYIAGMTLWALVTVPR
jgi:quinol-cytochrome oxidoreductase complex cytochrome b subunit